MPFKAFPFAVALLLVFLSNSICSAQATDDDEVIRVDSSIVVVNVSVTDRAGKAVDAIPQRSFKILEDGVEQPIRSFEAGETPFAAVILIDTSGSMETRVSAARSAAIEFLYGLRRHDNAAVFNFASKVDLVQDFSNSRDLYERAFDLKADGQTSLNDAIYAAAQALEGRPEKRRAIIVLSDGADTSSKKSSSAALKAAQAVDAIIYTVDMSPMDLDGKSRMQNQGALKDFSDKTGGRFVSVPGGVAMRDAFKKFVEELGQQYTLTYSPSNSKADGKWRNIEVRIARPDLTIRTRKGYNAPKPPKR